VGITLNQIGDMKWGIAFMRE